MTPVRAAAGKNIKSVMGNKVQLEKLIIDVQIHDLNRAVDFYRDVLGLPLIHKDVDWASFEVSGAEIHLYLHGGIEYGLEFRVANIKEEIKRLKNKGVKFFTDSSWPHLKRIISDEIMEFPWGKVSLFKDSEGNQLVIVEDL
jgi:catechol 2,3-dioxygenase-like lactoylglutathione lyase family enzyme